MTTLDNDLSELRRRLHRAAANDLRRGRRRRRVAQLALVPAVLLTGAGGALAVAPMLGEPAPTPVQQEFRDDRSRPPAPGSESSLPGPDTPLYAVAGAGGSTLYAATTPGGWCVVVGREDESGRATDGYSCQSNDVPKPGEVAVVHAGGASDRAHNVATGYVRDAAKTVTISLSTGETVDGPIGRDGFFIVQLPDSVLNDSSPPVVGAAARNADGEVVARWRATG